MLSFVVETSGGCAFFDAYEGGQRVRRIQSVDGVVRAEGERLPQEAGLPESRYDVDETEQLQHAFGITPPPALPPHQAVTAAAYVDRTDYSALRQARHARAASAPRTRRPWWCFWQIVGQGRPQRASSFCVCGCRRM